MQKIQQTWTTTSDQCCMPFAEKWAEKHIYIYIFINFVCASQNFTFDYGLNTR
jgi:hypothetical protein